MCFETASSTERQAGCSAGSKQQKQQQQQARSDEGIDLKRGGNRKMKINESELEESVSASAVNCTAGRYDRQGAKMSVMRNGERE